MLCKYYSPLLTSPFLFPNRVIRRCARPPTLNPGWTNAGWSWSCPWGGNNGTNQTLLVWFRPWHPFLLFAFPCLRSVFKIRKKTSAVAKKYFVPGGCMFGIPLLVVYSYKCPCFSTHLQYYRHKQRDYSIGLPAYFIISVLHTPECVCNNDLQWTVGQPSYRHGAVPHTFPIG